MNIRVNSLICIKLCFVNLKVKEENGKKEGEEEEEEEREQCLRMGGKRSGNIGQWRPSLQSIPEVGS